MEEMEFVLSESEKIRLRLYPRDLGQVVECTGQTLWRGSELLARWCWQQESNWGSCVELGCGLGLCSLALARRRPEATIVATDGDELAMEALRENLKLNNSESVAAKTLVWGDLETAGKLRNDFASDGFDAVVAADVVYNESSVAPLLQTVKVLLKATGIFVLAFTHRGVNFETVLAAAKEADLHLERRTVASDNDGLVTSSLDCLALFRPTAALASRGGHIVVPPR